MLPGAWQDVWGRADWVTAAGTVILAGATLLLAFVAAFQDRIRSWIMRPRLNIAVECRPPDCHKTSVEATEQGIAKVRSDAYYLRFRVGNSGNQRAELVEVYAAELLRQQADGSFKRVNEFLPMNFLWSHVRKPFLEAISPGMEKSCDLAHIIKPDSRRHFSQEDDPRLGARQDETILSLDLQIRPFTMSHLLAPGTYRLRLLVAAANTRPLAKVIEIFHRGGWYDDEGRMLSDGIGLRIVPGR